MEHPERSRQSVHRGSSLRNQSGNNHPAVVIVYSGNEAWNVLKPVLASTIIMSYGIPTPWFSQCPTGCIEFSTGWVLTPGITSEGQFEKNEIMHSMNVAIPPLSTEAPKTQPHKKGT